MRHPRGWQMLVALGQGPIHGLLILAGAAYLASPRNLAGELLFSITVIPSGLLGLTGCGCLVAPIVVGGAPDRWIVRGWWGTALAALGYSIGTTVAMWMWAQESW